jgi:hypothetical protein
MTGHRPFTELTKGFYTGAPGSRGGRSPAALREEMTIEELRKVRDFSQEEIAQALAVGQPAVAKLEKRTDKRISNLRRYIEALGGKLEIAGRFPDACVVINNVGDT